MARNDWFNPYYVKPLCTYAKARSRLFWEIAATLAATLAVIIIGILI